MRYFIKSTSLCSKRIEVIEVDREEVEIVQGKQKNKKVFGKVIFAANSNYRPGDRWSISAAKLTYLSEYEFSKQGFDLSQYFSLPPINYLHFHEHC